MVGSDQFISRRKTPVGEQRPFLSVQQGSKGGFQQARGLPPRRAVPSGELSYPDFRRARDGATGSDCVPERNKRSYLFGKLYTTMSTLSPSSSR